MPDVVAGVVGIAFLLVWLYCLYDVLTTDDALIRHLPKIGWFLIVLLLADLGSILWLCLGRPRLTQVRSTRPAHTAPSHAGSAWAVPDPTGLDDLHPIVREREERARLRVWEAQLARREGELRSRELGGGADR